MFTSRAEFRLHLRIDNADRRLTPHGRRVGLISDGAWADFLAKQQRMKAMRELLERTRVDAAMLRDHVSSFEFQVSSRASDGSALETRNSKLETVLGVTLAQLLKRPEVQIEQLVPVLTKLMPAFFPGDVMLDSGRKKRCHPERSDRRKRSRRTPTLRG